MKQLIRNLAGCLKVMLISITGYAQANITQAEYFFDADPGFGNGTTIAVGTPAISKAALSFNANVTALTNGVHTLYVRSKTSTGIWSQTNSTFFARIQSIGTNPNTVSNISKAEYFFDADPGVGNGSSISITPSANLSGVTFNVNVAALTTGIHTLYVRTKDAAGWSITQNLLFAKYQPLSGNPNTIANITRAEYFYDTDPGFGNGTSIPVTPSPDLSALAFNANVSSLTTGVHTMYIRTADAQGQWSEAQKLTFVRFQSLSGNPNTSSNIVNAEYFFNNDPGIGNGTSIPITAASDINGLVVNADVSSLPTGLHTIYLRTQDAQGKWSITSFWQFSRIQGLQSNPHTLSRINKAEYFYDADPGNGNGTNIPVTPSYDVSQLTFNANVTALATGVHTMYVRIRDSLGQWSELSKFFFVKVQGLAVNPHTVGNIVKAEYFFDTDPGYDLGVNVPVTAATDINALSFTANVAALSNGVHLLYFRAMDANGQWSEVNRVVFAKVQALAGNPHTTSNMVQAEYFVDTDPGIGNGVAIPFTPATDAANISFNVDMTVLVNGAHTLYMRSKDAQGKWSITNIYAFNGGTAPLAMKLLSFDAILQQSGSVALNWTTAEENNVARYTIERSSNASEWKLVDHQSPAIPDGAAQRHYQIIDEHPGTGIVYYRLTETDLNGQSTQAPIRFVRIDKDEIVSSTLYPNPNDGEKLTISSSLFATGPVTITIISADGKMHLLQDFNDTAAHLVTLSGLKLSPGNYFVLLRNVHTTETLKLQVMPERL